MSDQRLNSPPGYPVIGHWWHFKRDRLGFLTDCHRRYGETTLLRIVSRTYLINSPDDINYVLVAREDNFRKNWRVIGRAGKHMFANALLTKKGQPHRRQRRLVQPAFHRQALLAFVEAINAHIESVLSSWTGDTAVDIAASMDSFAEDVIIRALLGELDEDTRSRLSTTNRARRRFINHAFRIQFPFPQLLPTRRNWEYRRASQVQRNLMRDVVGRVRGGEIGSPSLLSAMIDSRNSQGDHLSDDELAEEISELLTAGYETTREALTWALYLMAKHPDCAARLRAEVSRVADGRAIRDEDVPQLVYAEMFFSEALRLYPPAWMFVRVAVEDDVLPSGVHVPAGSKIYLCQYTAHRNDEFFPDPERFDPDRFLPEARKSRPKFAYFPFGGGPRVCVAESFARLEGALVLASVARRFELELCPGQSVEPLGAITLRPRSGILARMRELAPRLRSQNGPRT